MVNYYELLEISQDADKTTVEQAIRKTRRLWNNRANSPDASIRAEAEQHVREIAEAEKILLDADKREEYNRQLAQSPKDDGRDQRPSVDADWEEEFFQAYNSDLGDIAASIAQRVISADSQNGRAWFLYGEALRRGGKIEQSIDPLRRATMLLPNDDGVFRQLGFAYYDLKHLADAYKAFKNASILAPNNSEYHALCANCLRNVGMIPEALEEAKSAHELAPNDDVVRFEFFVALHEDAMAAMAYNRSSGKHLIINKVQLDYVNKALKAMALTIPQDENKAQCTAAMEEIAKIAVDAESIKGGGFLRAGKVGYEYNYEISNSDTRASGKH